MTPPGTINFFLMDKDSSLVSSKLVFRRKRKKQSSADNSLKKSVNFKRKLKISEMNIKKNSVTSLEKLKFKGCIASAVKRLKLDNDTFAKEPKVILKKLDLTTCSLKINKPDYLKRSKYKHLIKNKIIDANLHKRKSSVIKLAEDHKEKMEKSLELKKVNHQISLPNIAAYTQKKKKSNVNLLLPLKNGLQISEKKSSIKDKSILNIDKNVEFMLKSSSAIKTVQAKTDICQNKPSPKLNKSIRNDNSKIRDLDYEHIEENLYLFERKKNKRKKINNLCNCEKDEKSNTRSCSDSCLNRMVFIECGSKCKSGDKCTNKRFQNKEYVKTEPFWAESKGFGLRVLEDVSEGQFVIEYVGEVLNRKQFNDRKEQYCQEKKHHHYFMTLNTDEFIDATKKGNHSRFINHSCDPNCFTQKWSVSGKNRIGIFSKRNICAGEELCFDYQLEVYGREAQDCHCKAVNCKGYIGSKDKRSFFSCNAESSAESTKKTNKILKTEEASDDTFEVKEEIRKLKKVGKIKVQENILALSRLLIRKLKPKTQLFLLDLILKASRNHQEFFLKNDGLKIIWTMTSTEKCTVKYKLLKLLSVLPILDVHLQETKLFEVLKSWSELDKEKNPINMNTEINILNQKISMDAKKLLMKWTKGNGQKVSTEVLNILSKIVDDVSSKGELSVNSELNPTHQSSQLTSPNKLQYVIAENSIVSEEKPEQATLNSSTSTSPSSLELSSDQVFNASIDSLSESINKDESRKKSLSVINVSPCQTTQPYNILQTPEEKNFESDASSIECLEPKSLYSSFLPQIFPVNSELSNSTPIQSSPNSSSLESSEIRPILKKPYYCIKPRDRNKEEVHSISVSAKKLDDPKQEIMPFDELVLPKNWKSALSNNGRIFFYNEITNRSQWDFPTEEESKVPATCIKKTEDLEKRNALASSSSTSESSREDLDISHLNEIVTDYLIKYKHPTCTRGKITSSSDLKYLANKITHHILMKEKKHCEESKKSMKISTSVVIKTKKYIRKYMQNCGPVFKR